MRSSSLFRNALTSPTLADRPGDPAAHAADHPPCQAVPVLVEHDVGVEVPVAHQRRRADRRTVPTLPAPRRTISPSAWLTIADGISIFPSPPVVKACPATLLVMIAAIAPAFWAFTP